MPVLSVVVIAVSVAMAVGFGAKQPITNGPQCDALSAYLAYSARQTTKSIEVNALIPDPKHNEAWLDEGLERNPEMRTSPEIIALRKQIAWKNLDVFKICSKVREQKIARNLQFAPETSHDDRNWPKWHRSHNFLAVGMPVQTPDGRVYLDVTHRCGSLCGGTMVMILAKNREGMWIVEREIVLGIS